MDAGSLFAGILIGVAVGLAIGIAVMRGRIAAAQASAAAAREKADYIENGMVERFRALSAQALDATNQQLVETVNGRLEVAGAEATGELERRKQAVEHLVQPLKETLNRVESRLREFDAARRSAHAELTQQVEFARRSSEELREATRSLVTALRRPEARGRWGELQLRRVVELAGMTAHCDFTEQPSVETDDGTRRPDLVVHLAGGKHVVIDAKVSLAAYLEAAEATDEAHRANRIDAHARHLRQHVDRLASKAYWSAFSPAPEFVVAFIPGEAFLAPALEADPGLLEHAIARRVHIATPTTLITMLRTAQYAWQQEALSDNARAVFDLGRQLYERLSTMGRHVDGLGKALDRAVTAYNQTVGSLETRVLSTARKLDDLDVVDATLPTPHLVEGTTRSLSAPELRDDAQSEQGPRPLAR